MRGYTSGQISGLTQAEYTENFDRADLLLLKLGFEPVNPIKVTACEDEDCNDTGDLKEDGTYLHNYQCYMKHDFKALLDCDVICMLPNHLDSKGASQELALAVWSGITVYQINDNYTDMKRIDS